MREKKREVEFRQKMITKVNEAKKFDAEKYVDEYLEDMKYRLVPKTYKVNTVVEFLGHITLLSNSKLLGIKLVKITGNF